MKSLYISSLFALVILVSCEEPYFLDLKQTPERIVIEAQVTDRDYLNYVKVTRSAHFYSSGATPRVTNAMVTVTDDAGNTFNFIHNPGGDDDSTGIYLPATPFAGVVGRTYKLQVQVDGQLYEATDKLASVIPVDSLSVRIDEEEAEDPEHEGKFYEVLLYAKEPQDEENYYLFKFFRNDSLKTANDTDIYYSDDQLLAENIEGIPAPIYYGVGDTARIEAYSISRQGYVFYNDMSSLLNNDAGGMFGPIPASPRTNLSNGALGFFQVSAVAIKGIKVE